MNLVKHTEVETTELIPGKPMNVVVRCEVRAITLEWKPPDYHPKSVKRYEVLILKKALKHLVT